MAQSQDSNSLFELGDLNQLAGTNIAIVYTEWNEDIVAEQVKGAEQVCFDTDAHIVASVKVPGCVEIPFGCRALWQSYETKETRPEAIIAFGAVIRGGTPHFDYVCKMVSEGISQLNLTLPIPVIFGVLTLDTEAQAWERLGGSHGHKGMEAAIAALKMARLNKQLKQH